MSAFEDLENEENEMDGLDDDIVDDDDEFDDDEVENAMVGLDDDDQFNDDEFFDDDDEFDDDDDIDDDFSEPTVGRPAFNDDQGFDGGSGFVATDSPTMYNDDFRPDEDDDDDEVRAEAFENEQNDEVKANLDADIQELLNDFDAALATPSPTNAPTKEPTVAPTNAPTVATSAPTKSPTYYPSSLVEKIEDAEDEIEAWEETLEEDEELLGDEDDDDDDDDDVDDDDDFDDDDDVDDDDVDDDDDDDDAVVAPPPPPPVGAPTQSPTYFPSYVDDVDDDDEFPQTSPPSLRPTPVPPTLPPTKAVNEKVKNDVTVKEDEIDPLHSMGFQSNWGPYSTYSGSMMYDFTRNSIYVTGTTYEKNTFAETPPQATPMPQSSCFVAQIPLADIQLGWKLLNPPLNQEVDPDYVIPDSLEEDEQLACSTILYDSTQSQKAGGDYLYVGGVDEMKMDDRDDGTISSFVTVYDRTSNSPEWTNKQISSAVFVNPSAAVAGTTTTSDEPPIPVRYPIGMVHGYDRTAPGVVEIAVISVSSQDSLLTDAFIENDDKSNPKNYKHSLLPPGIGSHSNTKKQDYFKRGSNFYPSFQIFQIESYAKTKAVVFTSGEDFESKDPTNKKYNNIFPTGITNLLVQGQHYVFVGSYRGAGCTAFGRASEATNATDHDYDGFAASVTFSGGVVSRPTYGPALRVHSMQTEPNVHDYVHGVCNHPGETEDDLYYYMVGSTYGTMPKGTNQTDYNVKLEGTILDNDATMLSSWISKIDAASQTVLWTTQVYATKNNEAFGCHVIPSDPATMYVGGTVHNNGSMMYVRSGPENKIRKSTYKENGGGKSAGKDDIWVAQLNTDDGALKWMKQIGSTGDDHISRTNGVQADVVGDCIIYGDTNGELYRSRSKDPRQTDGNPSTGTDIFVVKLDKRNGNYVSTIDMDRVAFSASSKKIGWLVAGIAFILLSLCMFACLFYKYRRPKRRTTNNINGLDNEGLFTDGVLTSYRDNDACDPVDDIIEAHDDGHDGNYHDGGPTANGVAGGTDEIATAITQSYNNKMTTNGNGRPNPVSSSYSDDVPPSHPHVNEENQAAKVDINGNDNNNNASSQNNEMDQTAFKDDPDYRPGRNFV